MRWFRMYNEIMDDNKMRGLSDRVFRHMVLLFALANEQDKDGVIEMTVEEAAWRLRVQPKELSVSVQILASSGRGILAVTDKTITVSNYFKRQFESDDSAERKRRQRERDRESRSVSRDTSRDMSLDCPVTRPVLEKRREEKSREDEESVTYAGKFFTIRKINHDKFLEAYPDLNLLNQYARMDAWLLANPQSRKKNVLRFVNNWLARAEPDGDQAAPMEQLVRPAQDLEICAANVRQTARGHRWCELELSGAIQKCANACTGYCLKTNGFEDVPLRELPVGVC